MGRAKRAAVRSPRAAPRDASDLDLSELLSTRVSQQAKKMVKEIARDDGVLPSTWLRRTVYRAIGLIKKDE